MKKYVDILSAVEIIKEVHSRFLSYPCKYNCEICPFKDSENCLTELYALLTLEVLTGLKFNNLLEGEDHDQT